MDCGLARLKQFMNRNKNAFAFPPDKHEHSNAIVIAGMSQSGSTLLFNLIRQIYLQSGVSVYSAWFSDYHNKRKEKAHILKIHSFNPHVLEWADLVFTTRRDLRDCVASALRRSETYLHTNAALFARVRVQEYKDWEHHSDFEFVYEDYCHNPEPVVTKIVEKLQIDPALIDIKAVIHAVIELSHSQDLPKTDDFSNPLYKQTLLSKSHLTNGGKVGGWKNGGLLTHEIKIIHNEHGDWLREKGYL